MEARLDFDKMSDAELKVEAEKLREARSKAVQALRKRTNKAKTAAKPDRQVFTLD